MNKESHILLGQWLLKQYLQFAHPALLSNEWGKYIGSEIRQWIITQQPFMIPINTIWCECFLNSDCL